MLLLQLDYLFAPKLLKPKPLGIIKKQGIQGTIYSYLGVLIGFVTTGIMFPLMLTQSEIGLFKVLVSVSTLFAQFAGLGFCTVTIRNFPFFRNEKTDHHGFLRLSLIVNVIGLAISILIFLAITPYIIKTNDEKSALFVEYVYYIIPLIVFTAFFNILDAYFRALNNAITGLFYKEFVQRILIIVAIFAYYFSFIDFHWLVIFYVTALCIPTLFLAFSIYRKGEFRLGWDKNFITKTMAKQLFEVALFGVVTSYSGVLIINIDVIMINNMLGLSEAGIYTIMFYFGTMVGIPARSIIRIAAPLISEGWKENDLKKIDSIYSKSNLTLTVIGLLLFMGLCINLDNIFTFLPDYELGRYVIVFIGLGNLIEMATSVSQTIITNSKDYKVIAWLMLLFIVLLIVTNLIMIPQHGIVGASIASVFSRFVYNLISWFFVYKKYGLQPFNSKYILLLLIAAFSYFVATMIPVFDWFIWDILVRSATITVVFGLLVYVFKISKDINETIDNVLKKTGIQFKK